MPYKKPVRSYEHGGLVHVPDVVGRADESADSTMRALEQSKKDLEALRKKLLGDNPGTKKREDRAETHTNNPKPNSNKPKPNSNKPKKPKQPFPGKIFRWPI